ncbi:MAG: efflux RND transporter periplasmic adaptor subunit [Gemmatimonadota bacterium]|jgi:cobalt-zinc-cadmium efflux system membrane fusion protein
MITNERRIRWTTGLAWMLTVALTAACGGPSETADPHDQEAESAGGMPEVHLDADALALSDVELDVAEEVAVGGLQVTGAITYDQNRVSHVGPKTEGRVVELHVEVGTRVTEGQVLAHLESPEVGNTRAELTETEALVEIARENFERETRLEAQGISSRREVLDAEARLRTVEARRRSAEERLRLLGAAEHGDGHGGHFDIIAPYDGVVVERHGSRGEVVGPADNLFTVADLTRLWIELDIFERDLSLVSEGQSVEVTTAAWPGRTFPARIVYVGDVLDATRRTVPARVEIDNTDGALKPGMFATAVIETAGGESTLAVPRDAVQNVEGTEVVWVPGAEPGAFTARPVLAGRELPGGLIEIVSGLAAGDSFVVAGAFTLKAELAKGEFGGHHH